MATNTQFESFKDQVRAQGGHFGCISQIKDEAGNSVERWQVNFPGPPHQKIFVAVLHDGGFDFYPFDQSLSISKAVADFCELETEGES